MYRPLGFYGELGDVEIIEHNGQLHLFHLTIPNRDLVAHIVSGDGLSWRALPPAIRTGDPGDCDDNMIRTMSVTRHTDGLFYMLYTATARADGGLVERTALAVSEDLIHFEKYAGNPVAEPGSPLYERERGERMFVSWRDPKPYFEDGVYYCVNCARYARGPEMRRGSVQLMTSADLKNWKIEAPIFAPMQYYDIECPQLMKIGEYYFLLGSVMEDRSQRYWYARDIRGPYLTPPNNLLAPAYGHYAGRAAEFNGALIFCDWLSEPEDGPSPYGLLSFQGEALRYVPSPYRLMNSGCELWLEPYGGWERYKDGPAVALTLRRALLGNETAGVPGENSVTVLSGCEIATTGEAFAYGQYEGVLRVDAPCGGLALNLDENGNGYFIEFRPLTNTVTLVKQHAITKAPEGVAWYGYEKRQSNYADLSGLKDGIGFCLRAVNGEIELSLGGRLVLASISTMRTRGLFGVYAESGTACINGLRFTPLRAPENL